jgi:hypothetical protein
MQDPADQVAAAAVALDADYVPDSPARPWTSLFQLLGRAKYY